MLWLLLTAASSIAGVVEPATSSAGKPLTTVTIAYEIGGLNIIEDAYNTQPVHHLNDTIVRLFRLQGPILNVNQSALPDWKVALAAGSAGQQKPVCPILMCVDGFGGGLVVAVDWQMQYADTMIKLGGNVTTRTYPNDDHFSLPFSCVHDAKEWLTSLL